ncbi:MAG TPA: hypothetical protein VLQ48_15790, partial [Chloroflexia bacterium]|nr:hypothetical protein [Chloroflexia bacterium]
AISPETDHPHKPLDIAVLGSDEGQRKKEEDVRHCTVITLLHPFSTALRQEKEGAFSFPLICL